ncbi:MAG TPA: HNH endonuclease [Pyrinomonadaceae bacterium]|jgi:5-methylcytosine-specific restriction endonuclease McrA
MGNYIFENRDILSGRHYIRKAGTEKYWFDFAHDKLKRYQDQFGDDFCMVIYGSETEDDAYVMPYTGVKELFTVESLGNRNRWVGYIQDNVVRLSPGARSMSASAYYNAFDLLDKEGLESATESAKAEIISANSINLASIKERINQFNQRYRDAIPLKRRTVSEQVARPGAVTDYLKRIHDYICQICGEQGFMQLNGMHYIEAHHIVELHKIIPGSYCSDNIVVVCATCHRKLHYAKVSYSSIDSERIAVYINEARYEFRRNLIS